MTQTRTHAAAKYCFNDVPTWMWKCEYIFFSFRYIIGIGQTDGFAKTISRSACIAWWRAIKWQATREAWALQADCPLSENRIFTTRRYASVRSLLSSGVRRLSVRPSVCPSVTGVYFTQTAEDIVIFLSRSGSPVILDFFSNLSVDTQFQWEPLQPGR